MGSDKKFTISLCINDGIECATLEELRSSKRARRIFEFIKAAVLAAVLNGEFDEVVKYAAELLGKDVDRVRTVDILLLRVKGGEVQPIDAVRLERGRGGVHDGGAG